MPLGQTRWHFPHKRQREAIANASSSLPRCNISIIFLRETSEFVPAVHVAVHEPQAIQMATSGSVFFKMSNLA